MFRHTFGQSMCSYVTGRSYCAGLHVSTLDATVDALHRAAPQQLVAVYTGRDKATVANPFVLSKKSPWSTS